MRHRNTVALMVLFLAGVVVLWWADYADLPTREKQRELSNRLLPELIDTPVGDVRRIEIDRRGGANKDRIVVERRAPGAWQLVEPVDAAADPDIAETLARNLKDLRKSPSAGTITGDLSPYKLNQAEVKVYVKSRKAPAATLSVGDLSENRAYVRPGRDPGAEVIESRALSPVGLPASRWRDQALFRVPSFRVKGVSVREAGTPQPLSVERDERRWRLTSPIQAPADNDKAEGLAAELSALRVSEGDRGFVADDVPAGRLTEYGLDDPWMTVTVTPFDNSGPPQTLRIGKVAGDGKEQDERFAMRGDQNDVVRLNVKRLRESIPGPNVLRSQAVLDFAPGRVKRVGIETRGTNFILLRGPAGWRLESPVSEKADSAAVQTLLARLVELNASEFIDPARVPSPGLEPPAVRVQGWAEVALVAKESKALFDISFGRHDGLRKTVYGRVAGDTAVLALPDSILKELPRNKFAYRDRAVLSIEPPQFASITVERQGLSATVEAPPKTGATGMHWAMTRPVRAPADEAAVTNLLLTLGGLRAEVWESDRVGDGKKYGLDAPWLRVKWTLQPGSGPAAGGRGVLRLGKAKPEDVTTYGNIEGDERVFALSPLNVMHLEAELHAQKVLTFKPEDASRLVLRWPSRTVALQKVGVPAGSPPAWEVSPGYDPSGFDSASRVAPVLAALSDLSTPRFVQYAGPLPEASGLKTPRVSVSVTVAGTSEPLTLRVGRGLDPTTFEATTAAGDEGPVFVLPSGPWDDILKVPSRVGDLPENVFVPDPPASTRPSAAVPGLPPGMTFGPAR